MTKFLFPYRWCRSRIGSLFFVMFCFAFVFLVINYFEGTLSPSRPPSSSDVNRVNSRLEGKSSRGRRKWGVQEVQVCKPPVLSLKKDTLKSAFQQDTVPHSKCQGAMFMHLENGVTSLNKKTVKSGRRSLECTYQYIVRDSASDDRFRYKGALKRTGKDQGGLSMKIERDFVRVQCSVPGGVNIRNKRTVSNTVPPKPRNTKAARTKKIAKRIKKRSPKNLSKKPSSQYDQFLMQVHPKSEVFNRIQKSILNKSPTALSMNIVIVSLESLSTLGMQRKLPQTFKYITGPLAGVVMNGYSVVGDDTISGMLPLLTGKAEEDVPDGRKDHISAEFLDKHPFLWYEFEKNGYATLFGEDSYDLGMFNSHLTGFRDEPTDHYLRPFWQAVKNSPADQRFCLHGQPKHQYMLRYVKDFYWTYRNVSRFALIHHHEMFPHSNQNLGQLDRALVNFLQAFEDKYPRNTMLVFVSNHGDRTSKISLHVQGKMEDRLPFLALIPPKTFQQKYPRLIAHMKSNARRLTTPFDVHETLLDFLDFSRTRRPPNFSSRGVSLFKPIPLNRTCESAGINPHWCSCVLWKPGDLENEWVKKAAEQVIETINRALSRYTRKCKAVSLAKIVDAKIVTVNEKTLKYVNAMLSEDDQADFTGTSTVEYVHYLITVRTSPNNALYEATVQLHLDKQTMTVLKDITRLDTENMTHAHCMEEVYGAKFCQCK